MMWRVLLSYKVKLKNELKPRKAQPYHEMEGSNKYQL